MFLTARIVLFLILIAIPVFAQTPKAADKEAEEKQRRNLALVEQLLTDSRGLRLPENRAFVAARAGQVFCIADPKRAHQLFESAVNDLIAGQTEAEAERAAVSRNFQQMKYGQHPRWPILFLIANCDAAFALEAMARSRPHRLDRAIAESRLSDQGYARQYANEESQNEHRLITVAADQDPALAIRRLRESLKRGVNYYTFSLLKKLASKDAEAAAGLTAEAVKKLLEEDFRTNPQSAETIAQFFNETTRETHPEEEKALRLPEELAREMANRLLRSWFDKNTTSYYGRSASLDAIGKYFPDGAARAKRKFEEMDKQNQTPEYSEYNRLMKAETPLEEMIAGAPKLGGYMRTEVYRRAAERLTQGGGQARAEKLLKENLPLDDAEMTILHLNVNHFYQVMGESKFDDALAVIERISNDEQKMNLLIYLATTIYNRDPKENEKTAASVLARARSLLPEEPETFDDISAIFNLANAYAPFDQNESFRMAESLVPLLNELDGANATITKLRNYGNFRRGEFQISGGQASMGFSGVDNFLRTLREKDFDRALEYTNGFDRLETRIIFRMQLIEGQVSFTGRFHRGGGFIIDGPEG